MASVAKAKDKQSTRTKSKGKSAPKSFNVVTGDARNEGENTDWAYKPPDGMVALDMSKVDEDFDWDAFEGDENKELWIIRIPEGFKAKQLNDLEIPVPTGASGSRLTTIEQKRSKYEVWSAGPKKYVVQGEPGVPAVGEEVGSLTCLLPRTKKKGRLYVAPRPILQHIVITQAAATPNIHDAVAAPSPTRESVPNELLKHRFLPCGALSAETNASDSMDMDVADTSPRSEEKAAKKKDSPDKPSKKRKVEALSPSKTSKKLKL